MVKWKVSVEEEGIKLGAFLQKRLGITYSARYIKRCIEENLCQLNERTERFASISLQRGDVVFLDMERKDLIVTPSAMEKERVLFEDDHFLIYNKPAGIACDESGMVSILRKSYPTIVLAHRLDKGTTGVLILAKQAEAEEKIQSLFLHKQIDKRYLALVDGVPKENSGTVVSYLAKIKDREGLVLWGSVVNQKGGKACTEWKCQKRGKDFSLVNCVPKTGRTHQIRVHMSEMGHPILGDYRYCRHFHCSHRPLRPLLHAQGVTFIHPITQEKLSIEATMPADFKDYLEILKLQ